jgi:leader peptidase (prepilin peptidase) / N-methyltransferase
MVRHRYRHILLRPHKCPLAVEPHSAYPDALSLCALGFLLIGLAVMDWQTQLLPDEFTLGGTFLGLVFIATETFFIPSVEYKTFFTPEEILIGKHILAALGGYLLLVLIRFLYKRLRKRDGMGLGDAKLLALIGIFLGFWPAIVALFVAVLTASIYGTALLLRGRATATSKLPFGSFLAAAGLLSALVGDRIIDWYATLFR